MNNISTTLIKELRNRTELGFIDCKNALIDANGDIELAIDNLRKQSVLKSAKKESRVAAEGVVLAKVSTDKSYGVLVEVNCETDFVAKDASFIDFVDSVINTAFDMKTDDVNAVMTGILESNRQSLVQKIGEKISVRRISIIEGNVIGAYIHQTNKIAVLVQLDGGNTETAKDIAMHVAATNPAVVSAEHMPESIIAKEKEIIRAQPDMAGKPDNIIEKMMTGRINKFIKEACLIDQPFVIQPDISVAQFAKKAGATVKHFIRMEVGEGIEKEKVDFAAEVAAQVQMSKS